MPKSTTSNSIAMSEVDEWESKEALRKSTHSAIEKRRRQKIQQQINLLKQLVPACTSRDDTEKYAILQSTADYIKEVHQLLRNIQKKDPSLIPDIAKYIPTAPNSRPMIMDLLPGYRPPPQFATTLHEQVLNTQVTRKPVVVPTPSPTSRPSSPVSFEMALHRARAMDGLIPSDDNKKRNPMRLDNLLS
ncbi:hypothetical protein BC833DRAFT_609245 [Globomyces pollinis-pini]|nr:hypothetical protein BC833DRAFT_609245 [Globomyces pollinis-pini]